MRKAVKTKDMIVGKAYYDLPGQDGAPYELQSKTDHEICFKPGENKNNWLLDPKTGLIPFSHMGLWYEEVAE